MDREIIFRGKTKDGRWMYGDLARRLIETKWQDILGEYQFAISGLGEREKCVDFKGKRAEVIKCKTVDPATVGQYTGLCDKNGEKIFEGDIVHCESRLDRADMVVIFEMGQFRIVLCEKFKSYATGVGYYDINCFNKTVIGNIYDNPELLGEIE